MKEFLVAVMAVSGFVVFLWLAYDWERDQLCLDIWMGLNNALVDTDKTGSFLRECTRDLWFTSERWKKYADGNWW